MIHFEPDNQGDSNSLIIQERDQNIYESQTRVPLPTNEGLKYERIFFKNIGRQVSQRGKRESMFNISNTNFEGVHKKKWYII